MKCETCPGEVRAEERPGLLVVVTAHGVRVHLTCDACLTALARQSGRHVTQVHGCLGGRPATFRVMRWEAAGEA